MTTSAPPSPFRVAIRDLPTHHAVSVDNTYVEDALRGHPLRDVLGAGVEAGEATLDLELYQDGSNVYASGTIAGRVVVACSRCVGPAAIPLDEDLNVTFMPKSAAVSEDVEEPRPAAAKAARAEKAALAAGGAKPAPDKAAATDTDDDDGVELDPDDLNLFTFEGEHVDLEPLIREHVVLAVPYAPLCKEDCLGLCPQCGIDRNVETCQCAKPIDPRFEALKGLKLPT